MKDILHSFRSKKSILRMLLAAVIFFAVALPFKTLFNLLPGITEIRPANVVPPVLAILWGPPAVFGITIGNLISDIVAKSNAFVCITGFIANFFYAYIPYKLWYSFRVDEKNIKPTLDHVGKIVKYIYIVLLDSVVVTGILSLIFETAGFNASGASYALLFFNNFDFSVLLGVPVLIIVEKLKPDYYVPKAVRKKPGSYIIFDLLLMISALIGFIWFAVSALTGSVVKSEMTRILLILSILLVVPCLCKPFNFDHVKQENKISDVRLTIKSKFTIGFLLLAVIFITIIGVTAVEAHSGEDRLALWSYVYTVLGISINLIFAMAIVYLWYVEKNIVKPIEDLTEATRKFAHRPDTAEIIEPELIKIDTKDEISSLADSFNTMMTDITTYMKNLQTVTAEKERIGAELDVATKIQASMLPCIFPAFPEREEFEVYATMNPAKEVGGDFYDFFMVDGENLAIVAADVSGKGVPAALFMVIGKTLIKDHTTSGKNLGEIFTEVNNLLCEANSEELFITAFVGVLNLKTGEFRYVNAGHEPPFISRKNAPFEPYKIRAGFVLAGMENMRYKEGVLQLEPGDKIFQYTDGVTEATDLNKELFGMERLQNALAKVSDQAPEEILAAVKSDIDAFVGEAPQFDDITMICLEYRKKQESMTA